MPLRDLVAATSESFSLSLDASKLAPEEAEAARVALRRALGELGGTPTDSSD